MQNKVVAVTAFMIDTTVISGSQSLYDDITTSYFLKMVYHFHTDDRKWHQFQIPFIKSNGSDTDCDIHIDMHVNIMTNSASDKNPIYRTKKEYFFISCYKLHFILLSS